MAKVLKKRSDCTNVLVASNNVVVGTAGMLDKKTDVSFQLFFPKICMNIDLQLRDHPSRAH